MAGNFVGQIEELVDDLIAAYGINQYEIAKRMRISPGYLSSLLSGAPGYRWNTDRLESLGKALEDLCVAKKAKPPALVVALGRHADLAGYRELCRKMQVILSAGGENEISIRKHIDALHQILTTPPPVGTAANARGRAAASR